jgi:hypothetical protein
LIKPDDKWDRVNHFYRTFDNKNMFAEQAPQMQFYNIPAILNMKLDGG